MTIRGRRTALIILGVWMLAIGIPALLIRGLHGWKVWGIIPGPALYAVVIIGGVAALTLAWRARPR